MRPTLTRLLLAVALAVPAGGCQNKDTIPGTEIPDTPDNLEILKVLERYRMAFVQRDAAVVLSTAHKTYHDEGGTDDPSDDVEYSDLGLILRSRLSQLDSIRFTMDYIGIEVHGDRAVVRVWIDAAFRMKPILDLQGNPRTPPRYSRKQDHAEFELLRQGRSWLIVRGL